MGKEKNGKIELLRFLFAVVIVVYHAGVLTSKDNILFPRGQFGVEFFFVISGYLMANSLEKNKMSDNESIGYSTFQFIKRKITSIYPCYIYAFAFSFVVYTLEKSLHIKEIILTFIRTIPEMLMLQMSGIEKLRINGLAWYISAMMLGMLILYPLAKKLKDSFTYILAPLIFLGIMGWLYRTYGGINQTEVWSGLIMKSQLRAIADLTLGYLCFFISKEIRNKKFSKAGRTGLLILENVCYLFIFYYMAFRVRIKGFAIIMLFVLAIAVSITFSRDAVENRIYQNKVCMFLGKFSLFIYLNHAYCRNLIRYLDLQISFAAKVGLLLVLSVVASLICMWVVGKFQNRKLEKKPA